MTKFSARFPIALAAILGGCASHVLPVGDLVPEWVLPTADGDTLSAKRLRGRPGSVRRGQLVRLLHHLQQLRLVRRDERLYDRHERGAHKRHLRRLEVDLDRVPGRRPVRGLRRLRRVRQRGRLRLLQLERHLPERRRGRPRERQAQALAEVLAIWANSCSSTGTP